MFILGKNKQNPDSNQDSNLLLDSLAYCFTFKRSSNFLFKNISFLTFHFPCPPYFLHLLPPIYQFPMKCNFTLINHTT